ncbi:hypothetical protein Tco_0333435 [Tanacetum coccineum]
MMRTTTSFLRGEVAASNQVRKKALPTWKRHETGRKQNCDKKGNFGNQQRSERRRDMLTLLTKSPKEILALDRGKFKAPPPMTTPRKRPAKGRKEGRSIHKGQSFGNFNGPTLAKGGQAKGHTKLLPRSRNLVPTLRRSPSSYNGIIRRPGVRKIQTVPSTAHGMLKFPVPGGILTLRSSKIILLECTMVSGPEAQPFASTRAAKERIKVAIHPKYPKQTIAIGFTLTEEGRKELCGLLRCNLVIFAWKPADMTGVPRHIAKHRLNVREGCPPVRQKKRSQALERNKAIQEEVERLVEAGIMKEVYYHSWLLIGMDKAKITRKPSKTGKHGHGKRKSTKEAGKSSQTRECHVDVKKAQEKRDFTLLSLTEQTQTSQSQIATLAIRMRSFSDLTAQDDFLIIEKLYGHD